MRKCELNQLAGDPPWQPKQASLQNMADGWERMFHSLGTSRTWYMVMSSLHRFNMLCQWTCIWCSGPVSQHQHLSSSTSTSIYKWLCTSVASVVMQRRRGERSSECAFAKLSTACQNEQSASLSCEPCLAWCYIPCYVLQPCTLCPIRCVQILIHGARSGF